MPTMLKQEQAEELLNTLLQRKGVLRVITSEVKPEYRENPDDPRSTAKDGVDLRDPDSMVLHDVVSIAPHPAREHHLVAETAEGDTVETYDGPLALLIRLLEWRYFDAANPAATYGKTAAVASAMYDALFGEDRVAAEPA